MSRLHSFDFWTLFAAVMFVGWYVTPGFAAIYHWTCARRDLLRRDALRQAYELRRDIRAYKIGTRP